MTLLHPAHAGPHDASVRPRSPRPPRWSLAAVTSAALLVIGCASSSSGGGPAGPPLSGGLRLERIVQGLDDPVHVAAPPHDSRLFIVEQTGKIRIFRNGALLPRPFLQITHLTSGGEQGLLSIAFHPQYATNGFFYVNYTDSKGDTRVERYTVSADSNVANPASVHLILAVAQPYANHNGGLCQFGPDGMLYIGMGDGGDAGDPQNRAQNLDNLLGKMLRIDVDHGDPYAIPSDNPFVGRAGARGEIWAYGLRNPWRFTFDPVDHRLFIADVGQGSWEEIDAAPDDQGGLNYGWRLMEGSHCYNPSRCNPAGLVLPVLDYSHSQGCSITGGVVYRGKAVPALNGHYLYADYCRGWIRSFRLVSGQITDHHEWSLAERPSVSSFGTDGAGEVCVVDRGGQIYRIMGAP